MARRRRKIFTLDANGQAIGRLASNIARILIGKHRVSFTPDRDGGDKVLVTNIGQAVFTGKKVAQKIYRHHTAHPGGLKEVPARSVFANPAQAVRLAVSRMLPRNSFRSARLRRLRFAS
ncbi:MAG: 50S ribosomal protein L13 [Candidatus Magasanikbacteria bacterium]|nr:50S ribosomal protein L13 [Candidatus Magasanikbacteria bacterium]